MGGSVTLAGDIGGTKAYLGMFQPEGEALGCLVSAEQLCQAV